MEEKYDGLRLVLDDVPTDFGRVVSAGLHFRNAKKLKLRLCKAMVLIMLGKETVHAAANRLLLRNATRFGALILALARVDYCELLGLELNDLNNFTRELFEIQAEHLVLFSSKMSHLKEIYDNILEVMVDDEKGCYAVERVPEVADMIEELQTTLGCNIESLLTLKKKDFEVQRNCILKLHKDNILAI